ncbi:hypothetical protein [Pseudoalteromonas maricaloris]|uniref:hypothetical protein n=1 Tax=Pseudoalteromonas maricaloris TaxID=184924 RepID=UPI003C24BD92
MMWKNQVLCWEETKHSWDDLGNDVTYNPIEKDDPLYAKVLVTWKEQTLEKLISGIIKSALAGYKASEKIESIEMLTGFTLAVSAINLFPFNLKIIKQDEYADKYLSLINEDESGEQFLLKSDVDFEIDFIIDYFMECGVMKEVDDRYFINGRVLNRSHLKKQNK